MRKVSGFLAVAMIAGLLGVSAPAIAHHRHWPHRIVVHHGQSIQAAVDRAHPGDTIIVRHGVYHESVEIRKNDLTLRGHHALIMPPSSPSTSTCTQALGPAGICVLAKGVDLTTGAVTTYTKHDRIGGFTIRGFDGFGIVTYGSWGTVIRHNRAQGNADYGITSFASTHNKFIHNVASGGGEAGFYFGDSPDADAVIRGNRSHDNLFGIFIRDASEGVIRHNKVWENCVGTLFLAGAPGPAEHWTYSHNKVWDNDKVCAATEEGAPPLSGVGVFVAGAHHIRITHNVIKGNHPKGDTAVSGGVVVASSIVPGTFVPRHNVVAHNVIEHNSPYDIVYDGTGADNVFRDNDCASSVPAGLC